VASGLLWPASVFHRSDHILMRERIERIDELNDRVVQLRASELRRPTNY
jgi:hypothetical protein